MTANRLHCDNQFGYKKYHSTETMLLGLTDEVLKGFDNGQCTIVLFLDLSAAFDTIDIDTLIDILGRNRDHRKGFRLVQVLPRWTYTKG